jgi:hypothetical protein
MIINPANSVQLQVSEQSRYVFILGTLRSNVQRQQKLLIIGQPVGDKPWVMVYPSPQHSQSTRSCDSDHFRINKKGLKGHTSRRKSQLGTCQGIKQPRLLKGLRSRIKSFVLQLRSLLFFPIAAPSDSNRCHPHSGHKFSAGAAGNRTVQTG